MPYIKQAMRPAIDAIIDQLVEHIGQLPLEDQDGSLNYALTRAMLGIYPRRYFHYNRALGVLAAVKEEFYRTVVGPYEDGKIAENGAVEPTPRAKRPAP